MSMNEIERTVGIRLRHVVEPDGTTRIEPLAHCPKRGKSIDARQCVGCARLRAMQWDPQTGGEIVCSSPGMPARPTPRTADLQEAAARTTLEDVTPLVTTCVAQDSSTESVRALFVEKGLRCAPVVDAEVRLVGIISRSDLTGSCDGLVRERTRGYVHALPEHAPLSYAIALMAFERINEVPVVTDEGDVVGVWTSSDALRWIAEKMGYVAPK